MERISKKNSYLLNTKQSGEALELLSSLSNNSADLVLFRSAIWKSG
ncbi:MAG: hypothetical protein MRERV_12c027 [Mycoplasmataceae bacterium RV_VA103A]|nr:MAG: hypothetical protein MRERV_12c027 [Mycoplasmataceae bacterium RV_VA103A]